MKIEPLRVYIQVLRVFSPINTALELNRTQIGYSRQQGQGIQGKHWFFPTAARLVG